MTYPHEVIRTRLREYSPFAYKGVFSGMLLIAKREGFRALFNGFGTHLIRVVPSASIMFLVYEQVIWILSFAY